MAILQKTSKVTQKQIFVGIVESIGKKMPRLFNKNIKIMTTQQNQLENAMREVVREMTDHQLTKRVPDLPAIDIRRLTYCLIRDRIAAYKAVEKEYTLDNVLIDFGVSARQTYYNWDKKYKDYYEKMQEK